MYHIRRNVLGEAARHKGTAGVRAGKEVVSPARPVVFAAGCDIIHGAIDGEEDGFLGVGAIVVLQLGVGVLLGAVLSGRKPEALKHVG